MVLKPLLNNKLRVHNFNFTRIIVSERFKDSETVMPRAPAFQQIHVDQSRFQMIKNSRFVLDFVSGLSNNLSVCKFQLALAVLSNLGSIYLAVILIVLKDICIICVSTYVVNALNYLLLQQKLKLLQEYYDEKKYK